MVNIHQQRKNSIRRMNQHYIEMKAREFKDNLAKLIQQYASGESWSCVSDPGTVKTVARCLNYRGITFTMTHSAVSDSIKVFFCQKTAERYLKDNPFFFDPHHRDRKLYSVIACNDPYIRAKYRTTVESGEHQYGIIV